MPRVYDLDDDDYFPREQGRKAPRGFPVLLSVGIGVGLIVMVAVALFAMRSSRQAAEQDAAAFARSGAPPRMMPADAMARRSNWTKVLGTWSRLPMGPDDTKSPLGFDFHQDMTAQMTWLLPDGSHEVGSFQVDLLVDEGDQLAIRFLAGKPAFTFQFTLDPDGTIVLRGTGTGHVFSRQ
jgi:hypothetical protein